MGEGYKNELLPGQTWPYLHVVLRIILDCHCHYVYVTFSFSSSPPSSLQVILLLAVTYWLVHLIWTFRFDPDNIAIPYLTALGDVLGTGLLAVAFNILWYLGDHDVDVGE